MRSSPDSSPSCWTCRLEWRPSRLLVFALLLLGVLAAVALMASALPMPARVVAAFAAVVSALSAAAREATRPVAEFEWAGGEQPARWRCSGRDEPLYDVRILERGPLLRLQGRDALGRSQWILWWPDTLARADRRAVRLLAGISHRSGSTLPSMAA